MEKKLIIFMHIPKTGGTTLNDIFKKSYAENEIYDHVPLEAMRNHFSQLKEEDKKEIKAISGHHFYGIHDLFSKPYTYFTMMRNPIERVISLYYFLKTYPGYYEENMRNMSFEEYIDWDPQARNGQIHQICGQNSQLSLEKAKENLKVFEVVGITEMFNESLLLLKNKFNWANIEYKKENVTKSRPRISEVSPKIIKKIEKNNELDIELYEFIKSNFIKQLKRAE
ncbi:sulfotransferase family 2 domain-containing protein [Priestia megaterium]|uniref:sulfotransferase family 2 domain-containing protein n=1 Tax=Priestia megaterium TaxID=1404 RepID=UPI002452C8FA|nr:sulfotransferase family 2 domain-containing protein [Priestia megaterium]MDH3161107.1 sulfotransferase family 2 domain-containing protein [Priestia megaterium]MDH3161119.1 sulfotransferase family 2 domain-containing protein [Priestia megaterium]MED4116868.1 sulfotransferase family 2 domain-containing protein [Priestia megaterium]